MKSGKYKVFRYRDKEPLNNGKGILYFIYWILLRFTASKPLKKYKLKYKKQKS